MRLNIKSSCQSQQSIAGVLKVRDKAMIGVWKSVTAVLDKKYNCFEAKVTTNTYYSKSSIGADHRDFGNFIRGDLLQFFKQRYHVVHDPSCILTFVCATDVLKWCNTLCYKMCSEIVAVRCEVIVLEHVCVHKHLPIAKCISTIALNCIDHGLEQLV